MVTLRLGAPVVLQIPGGARGPQGIRGDTGERGDTGPMGDVTPEALAAAANASAAAEQADGAKAAALGASASSSESSAAAADAASFAASSSGSVSANTYVAPYGYSGSFPQDFSLVMQDGTGVALVLMSAGRNVVYLATGGVGTVRFVASSAPFTLEINDVDGKSAGINIQQV